MSGTTRIRARRAADHRDDLRIVREPDRRMLNKLDGVSATVNFATEKATMDHDADVARSDGLRSQRSPAAGATAPSVAAARHGVTV